MKNKKILGVAFLVTLIVCIVFAVNSKSDDEKDKNNSISSSKPEYTQIYVSGSESLQSSEIQTLTDSNSYVSDIQDTESESMTSAENFIPDDDIQQDSQPSDDDSSYLPENSSADNIVSSLDNTAPASESDFEYEEIPDGKIKITKFTGKDKVISIPEKINGKTVAVIGENSFNGYTNSEHCAEIYAVSMPDTITKIEKSAFANCFKLQLVNMSKSITEIEEGAFASCKVLDLVAIPDSVEKIGKQAFYDCTRLANLKLGNNLKSIGEYAFYECDSLVNITIPDSVEELSKGVFACSDNIESVVLSKNISKIEDYLFYECDNLKDISIPEKVESIGEGAFAWTAIENIDIPANVSKISEGAFFSCMNLKRITIPETVTSIEKNAFGITQDDNNNEFAIDGVSIIGKKGSTAENYARNNNIEFKEN